MEFAVGARSLRSLTKAVLFFVPPADRLPSSARRHELDRVKQPIVECRGNPQFVGTVQGAFHSGSRNCGDLVPRALPQRGNMGLAGPLIVQ